MRLTGIAVVLALACAGPAFALSLPSEGTLAFDVLRRGRDIGDHIYQFTGDKTAFTVQVSTTVVVKVPLIRVTRYSFQHDSLEQWSDGKLQELHSETNDDGFLHKLNIATGGALPDSLWNRDIVETAELLDTIDGETVKIRVADLGTQSIQTRNGTIHAHHYHISGGIERDLWYDDDGNLAGVAFKARDGSRVTYIRK